MSVSARRILFLLSALVSGSVLAGAKLDPALSTRIAASGFGDRIPVIIQFADSFDRTPYLQLPNRQERRYRIVTDLKARVDGPVPTAVRAYLQSHGVREFKNLWINNSLAVTVPTSVIPVLSTWPGVAGIKLDAVVQPPDTTYTSSTAAEWNLHAVHAPDAWGQGYSGQGAVIAVMDTGVDLSHPDLGAQYRGGSNSWFDPYGEHAAPFDAKGHGTQVAGVALGRNASGNAIGVAPNAQWIAARIFNDADSATLSAMHLAFQWLLDPDGNPATNDAPDVINASWGLEGVPGGCSNEFQVDIAILKTADIAIVFSAGNDGPATSTTLSPGNNPGVLSVASTDNTAAVSTFSSRGPSACDGTIDPELAAPGEGVFTADTSLGLGFGSYVVANGTSFAAPHVAGAMAVLRSANPDLTVADLESILQQTAVDLGNSGPDNDFGSGLLDVNAALTQVRSNAPLAVADQVTVDEDQAVTIDVKANDSDPNGRVITITAVSNPSTRGGQVLLNANQTVTYTPAANFFGSDSFSYTLSNGIQSSVGLVTVTVNPVNDAPVAANDTFAITADAVTGLFQVAAPGVLANDTDVDGDVMTATLVTGVQSGSVTLDANGGFRYNPPLGPLPTGTLSFTYRVSDNSTPGNTATVSFTLNRPPVAQDDTFTLPPPDANGSYQLPAPGVLANDSDADGERLTAILVTNVQAGNVTLNALGGFSYVPPPGGAPSGTLSFTYRASDGRAESNIATVSFTANHVPVANNDTVVLTAASSSGPYTLKAPGVLANDTDADNDGLSVTLVSGPSTGTVNLSPDGAVTYLPPAGSTPAGPFSFTYRVSDGKANGNVATVQFSLNRFPVAVDDKDLVIEQTATGIVFGGSVLANDYDPDGNVLKARLLDDTSQGHISLTEWGSFTYTPPASGIPIGPLTFTYLPDDGNAVGDPGIVTFTIAPAGTGVITTGTGGGTDPYAGIVSGGSFGGSFGGGQSFGNGSFFGSTPPSTTATTNSTTQTAGRTEPGAPENTDTATTTRPRESGKTDRRPDPQVTDDDYTLRETDENGQYVVEAPGVLSNDRGEGKLLAILVTNVRLGKIAMRSDGSFVYTPPRGGTPSEAQTFRYRIKDDNGFSESATVTLTVSASLEARNDQLVLRLRHGKGQYLQDAPGVMANDVTSGKVHAELVQNVLVGQVQLADNGSFIYHPPASGILPKTPQSFTYRLVSGKKYSRVATATFLLAPELKAVPDALVLSVTDPQGRFVLPPPGLLTNDTGEGQLRAELTRNADHGKVELKPDGSLIYSPPAAGVPAMPPTFRYRISNGKETSQEAVVTLMLRPQPRQAALSSFPRRSARPVQSPRE